MRRAMGPFLTTGVALVAATVVVANPLTPPSRDMQISTTQLSTSPGMLTPFDKSLLNAIVPQFPPAGIGPALAQILAALAADADRISREVNSGGAVEETTTAAAPELSTYRPPTDNPLVESVGATPDASITGLAPPLTNPAVQAVVSGLVADTSYLGGKVVEAAYAVVDVIIRVPEAVIAAALALLHGDVAGALAVAKSAIQAFFGPGLIILDGIRDIIQQHLPPLPAAAAAETAADTGGVTLPGGTDQPTSPDPAPAADADNAPAVPGRTGNGGSARKRAATESLIALRPTTSSPKSRAGGAAGQVATHAASADAVSPPVPQSAATGSEAPKAGSARPDAASGSQRDLRPGAASGSAAD